MAVTIVEYHPDLQAGIDKMMEGIQAEFEIPITGPTSAHLHEFYKKPSYRFWVATDGVNIAGTIGVKLFGNDKAEIKRMMVDRKYRGSEAKTAVLLMDTAIAFAKSEGRKLIYLGTMKQFVAAQKFYLKIGYTEVAMEHLPADYIVNPMDTLFYFKTV